MSLKETVLTHRSAFSTFPYGRLLCGQRGCPSRTLYGGFSIAEELMLCKTPGAVHFSTLQRPGQRRGVTCKRKAYSEG